MLLYQHNPYARWGILYRMGIDLTPPPQADESLDGVPISQYTTSPNDDLVFEGLPSGYIYEQEDSPYVGTVAVKGLGSPEINFEITSWSQSSVSYQAGFLITPNEDLDGLRFVPHDLESPKPTRGYIYNNSTGELVADSSNSPFYTGTDFGYEVRTTLSAGTQYRVVWDGEGSDYNLAIADNYDYSGLENSIATVDAGWANGSEDPSTAYTEYVEPLTPIESPSIKFSTVYQGSGNIKMPPSGFVNYWTASSMQFDLATSAEVTRDLISYDPTEFENNDGPYQTSYTVLQSDIDGNTTYEYDGTENPYVSSLVTIDRTDYTTGPSYIISYADRFRV